MRMFIEHAHPYANGLRITMSPPSLARASPLDRGDSTASTIRQAGTNMRTAKPARNACKGHAM